MKPYFEEDGIVIYHGDCRDLVPHLSASILSDPPYGMNYKPLRGSDGSKRWSSGVTGDDEQFDPRWLLDDVRFPRVILWGANHYSSALPDSPGWIVWDKTSWLGVWKVAVLCVAFILCGVGAFAAFVLRAG